MATSYDSVVGQLEPFWLVSREEAASWIQDITKDYARSVQATRAAPHRADFHQSLKADCAMIAKLRTSLSSPLIAEFLALSDRNDGLGELRARAKIGELLEPETPWTTWLWPCVVALLVAGGEVLGLRRLRQHWASRESGSTSFQQESKSLT